MAADTVVTLTLCMQGQRCRCRGAGAAVALVPEACVLGLDPSLRPVDDATILLGATVARSSLPPAGEGVNLLETPQGSVPGIHRP